MYTMQVPQDHVQLERLILQLLCCEEHQCYMLFLFCSPRSGCSCSSSVYELVSESESARTNNNSSIDKHTYCRH